MTGHCCCHGWNCVEGGASNPLSDLCQGSPLLPFILSLQSLPRQPSSCVTLRAGLCPFTPPPCPADDNFTTTLQIQTQLLFLLERRTLTGSTYSVILNRLWETTFFYPSPGLNSSVAWAKFLPFLLNIYLFDCSGLSNSTWDQVP